MNKQIIQQNLDGCDDKWRGYTDKGEEKTSPFADWLAEEIEAQNILDRGEAVTLKEAYTVFYHGMAEYLEKEGDNEAASLLLDYINNEGTDWNLDEERLDYLVHLGYEFVHLEHAFEQQLVEQSEDYRNLKTRYSKQQGDFTIVYDRGNIERKTDMALTEWVIKDASNFDGHSYAYTVLYDGKDAYSDKTRDDYIAEGYDVLSDEEFDDYIKRVEENMCGHWSEITKEQYYDALDVLPPVDYKNGGFYISEATTGAVHAYYQEFSGKYYTCSQRIGTPREDIMNGLKDFISSQSKEKDIPEKGKPQKTIERD